MSKIQYSIVSQGDEANITVFVPGEAAPLVAHSTHANFDRIVAACLAGDANQDEIVPLFDIAQTVASRFDKLSERVSVSNGRVYFDGDEVDSSLTTQIVRFLNEDVEDWKPLVAFMENVQQNPNDHSRSQLYDWLNSHDFTITDEGNIVGYKGVHKDSEGNLVSGYRGTAIVDGVIVNGQIPNAKGSVIEMPRTAVAHDPSASCSTGLHVGTYAYAQSYARGAMLEVHVNPRDVVSVPTDAGGEKVRVCRYTVVDTIDAAYSTPYVSTSVEDDEDYCEECDDVCDDSCDEPETHNGFSVGDNVSDPDGDEGVIVGFDSDNDPLVRYDDDICLSDIAWDGEDLELL